MIWNVTHPVRVPIVHAKLYLVNPITGGPFHAESNSDGTFSFEQTPEGVYVLHVECGGAGREFSPADLLIRLSSSSHRKSLLLLRAATGCGGETVEVESVP